MKYIKYILLLIVISQFGLFAEEKDSLKNQKSEIENKIEKIRDFATEMDYARKSESLALYILLYEDVDSLGIKQLSAMFKRLSRFVDSYRTARSSLEELENILFDMQWHIVEREDDYTEMLGYWRSAWDQLAQNEITLKVKFNKLSMDCDTVLKQSIGRLKSDLALLQQDIKFSNEIDALNRIDKENIIKVISNFYAYVHKNNFERDREHIIRVHEADSGLYEKTIGIIDSFSNSELIDFVGRLNTIDDFDYKNHKKSLLKSDSLIYHYLAIDAGKRADSIMKSSVFLYNAAPVVRGSFEKTGRDIDFDEPFYVRSYPLTKEELAFFLIANNQYNLLPIIKMEQIIHSQREDIQQWYGIEFLDSTERDYMRSVVYNPSITQVYKAIIEPVPLDADNELIKLSINELPDSSRQTARQMAEEFWCELHPRSLLLKYSLGISAERFGFNSIYDKSNINIADWGRLSNSITVAWRFNFTGDKGDDTFSDYLGVKFENLYYMIDNDTYIHEHYENDSLNISGFGFNANEISLIFCHKDRMMVSAGLGFAEFEIEEETEEQVYKYSVDNSYYLFSLGYSQPLAEWLSADFSAKLYIMDEPFDLSGSAMISLSARLPFFRL